MLTALLCSSMLLTSALTFYSEGPSGWACQEVRAALDSGFPDWETEVCGWSSSWREDVGENSYPARIYRVQFCHLIGTILGKNKNLASYQQYEQAYDAGYREQFSDMKRVYYNYDVYLANYLGIIDGVSESIFDPYGTLTREQAAKILAKTIVALRPSLWQEGKNYMADKTFSDQDEISPWAANYIGFVIDLGLMSGLGDGKFAPQAPYTTEQAIVTCYRLCRQLQVPGTISAEQANLWLDTYHMNREIKFGSDYLVDPNAVDISIYYGGVADGIATISVGKITVDGIGELGAPFYLYGAEEGYPVGVYKAELHAAARDMQMHTYYTAHVELTLTMEDGGRKQITDTFVFLY
ncbi:hypothetical protein SDC9_70737 [bioreactor metagenome]|uniref:SLH domain-containing protein n=1 Tax=bioreactor metagenome TaxID=1076179 RepID=A0A644Y6R8_9ZZZZ